MQRIVAYILVAGLLASCDSPQTRPDVSVETQRALSRLHVGMKEADAVALMRPVSLDWGRVDHGGSGAGRLYFQISGAQQVWLDAGGSLSDWTVTAIGVPEPKSKWTRHGGDSITVE